MDDRWMQACALGAGGLGRWEAPEGQGTRGPGSKAWPCTPLATLPRLGGELRASSVPACGGGSGK